MQSFMTSCELLYMEFLFHVRAITTSCELLCIVSCFLVVLNNFQGATLYKDPVSHAVCLLAAVL